MAVTVSIRRMSVGAGYRYLMSSVARGDGAGPVSSPLTAYYAESGTPPGRFLGAGLAGLDGGRGIVAGTVVTEQQLFRMLGMLQDPVTGQPLGRLPRTCPTAYIDPTTGSRRVSGPVAGFDLTFSAPKSVSVAWALADPGTQAVIYRAHLDAVQQVISYAEQVIFTSRSGKAGVVIEDIRGVVGAAFDHWDSRAGDPQLHTHVVVLNRVQCADGEWRTLDGRVVFRATVALSELYNAVLSDYLTAALGWGWEPLGRRHSVVPKFEVSGVPETLQAEFSQRAAAIEDAKEDLVAAFVTARGRQPSGREVLKLRQQATLSTRPGKEQHLLAEQMAVWRGRATPVVGPDPAAWVGTLAGRNNLPLLHAGDLGDPMLADAAAVALGVVAGKRATFGRLNVFAEALRQFHGARFATPGDRIAVAERATDLALEQALLISPPELAHTPAAFRRADGTSRFGARGFATYTTTDTLDAETRLLDAGRRIDGPGVSAGLAAHVTGQPLPGHQLPGYGLPGQGVRLSADQARAVQHVVTSGRVVDVLVGAAGTGKSTTMAGVRAVWQERYGPGSVIGLAPSAAAADVLSQVVGIDTENTTKWLTETDRNTTRLEQIQDLQARLRTASPSLATRAMRDRLKALAGEVQRWSLRPGQLVIIDEASMAGTFDLDALTTQAQAVGAKLLLVGDWAQLSPVAAGGAFALLVHDRDDPAELVDVRRFRHEWERTASVGLRTGDADAVDVYDAHGRITGGDRDTMLDALYAGWRSDVNAGVRSLMIAGDNDTVADLNARARADRVAAGQVSRDGVPIGEGAVAGAGDLVVTRRNDRTLPTGAGWVKNGDTWTITRTEPSGAITVRRAGGGGTAVLPPDYVGEHVELGYASTAYRAQGRTVDTAHAFVSATTQREPLYVMATRGRESNRLYVDTMFDPDLDTAHITPDEVDAVEVLRHAAATTGAEQSATQTLADQWADAHCIRQLWAEYTTIAAAVNHDRYGPLIRSALGGVADLGQEAADTLERSPAYGPLLAAVQDAESDGLGVDRALPELIGGRPLTGADDIAAVLHRRVTRWATASRPPDEPVRPRIVGLFPAATTNDPDVNQALEDRRALIQHAARALTLTAIGLRQPWITSLGRPPADPAQREPWLHRADTIAAYRDHWHITGASVLGAEPRSLEQKRELVHAVVAAQTAQELFQTEDDCGHAPRSEPSRSATPRPDFRR